MVQQDCTENAGAKLERHLVKLVLRQDHNNPVLASPLGA